MYVTSCANSRTNQQLLGIGGFASQREITVLEQIRTSSQHDQFKTIIDNGELSFFRLFQDAIGFFQGHPLLCGYQLISGGHDLFQQ